jgi:hypothetical protein
MPVVDEKARVRKEKRRSRVAGAGGKMKRIGTAAKYEARTAGVGEDGAKEGEEGEGTLEDGERWLECQVVRELPLLWVKRSSLSHATVMMYNGET